VRTLLVATVGGQVGRAVLDAISGLRDRIRVVGVNSIADASANFLCDVTYLAPGTADLPVWLARMREILRAEQPDAVLAGRDEDLGPLAHLKAEPEFAAVLADNPGPASVGVLNDKYESWRFAQAHGLSFVETAVTRAEVAAMQARHGLPLIVKPRGGTEGRGVHALTRAVEVAAWLEVPGVAFQPFVAPPGLLDQGGHDPAFGTPAVFAAPWRTYLNLALSVAADGTVAFLGASELSIRARSESRHRAVDDPAAAAAGSAFAAALAAIDFRGPLVVQGRLDQAGRFLAFELNGRINAGVGGRAALGRDELAPVIERLTGIRRPPPPAAADAPLIEMSPDWEPVALPHAARLRAEGVWRAAS